MRVGPAVSAPAAGCRIHLSAGATTTVPHLDDRMRVGAEKKSHV